MWWLDLKWQSKEQKHANTHQSFFSWPWCTIQWNRTGPALNYRSMIHWKQKYTIEIFLPEASDAQFVNMQNKGLSGPNFSKNFKINCLHFVVLKVLRGHLPHGVTHLMVATCLKHKLWCFVFAMVWVLDGKEWKSPDGQLPDFFLCFVFLFRRVVLSKNPAFPVGSYVVGRCGWRTHTVCDETGLIPIMPDWPRDVSLSLALGTVGMPGWETNVRLKNEKICTCWFLQHLQPLGGYKAIFAKSAW